MISFLSCSIFIYVVGQIVEKLLTDFSNLDLDCDVRKSNQKLNDAKNL